MAARSGGTCKGFDVTSICRTDAEHQRISSAAMCQPKTSTLIPKPDTGARNRTRRAAGRTGFRGGRGREVE
jgi:hypothetical protein